MFDTVSSQALALLDRVGTPRSTFAEFGTEGEISGQLGRRPSHWVIWLASRASLVIGKEDRINHAGNFPMTCRRRK